MIDTTIISTEDLEKYDDMMVEASISIPHFSALAAGVWAEVLRELDIRGRVQLVSGSYSDIGNARINRLWS